MNSASLIRSSFSALLLALPFAVLACDGGSSTSTSTSGSGGGDTTASATGTGGMGGEAATTSSTSSSSSSSSTTGAGGAGGGSAAVGELKVNVAYAGAQVGSLAVVYLAKLPPMGPPDGAKKDTMPKFPEAFDFTGVKPGSYYVGAVLDIGNNNPTMPGPEDLSAFTMMPVDVKEGAATTVNVTLMDKAP